MRGRRRVTLSGIGSGPALRGGEITLREGEAGLPGGQYGGDMRRGAGDGEGLSGGQAGQSGGGLSEGLLHAGLNDQPFDIAASLAGMRGQRQMGRQMLRGGGQIVPLAEQIGQAQHGGGGQGRAAVVLRPGARALVERGRGVEAALLGM
jgi:hypothetical protein